ncbi:MAG: FAD:protein FMN transferase [Ignavibacteriaceae bacterium]|nr:FAD:protein FMN transferase [Ignavibacteriaceae bacterium]
MLKNPTKISPPLWGGVWGGAIVLFLIGFFIARNMGDETKEVKRTQILLGTVVDIQVRDTDEKKADDAITKAFAEIKRIDDLFTTYNEDSPVWQFNHSNDSIIAVDEEIYSLMVLCDSLWKMSDGCFDAAIESLIQTWGFDSNSPEVPNELEIKSALLESNWNKIKLINDGNVFRSVTTGLNFGAIAKGYAVDKAVDVLKNSGIQSALVNAGGEIKSIGNDWVVGVQHPREVNEIIKKLMLNGISVATSGDYENYFEKDNVRYHHILDPKTGYPSRGLQSVTVIHKDNAFADGLATSVFVMGKEKGIELIESLNETEAMIIDDEGKIFYTSGFEKFLIN